MNPPIIEITAHDDGRVTYVTRPSNFGPPHYGVILGALIQYLAEMLVVDNPRIDHDITVQEIVRNTLSALHEKDATREPLGRMQ